MADAGSRLVLPLDHQPPSGLSSSHGSRARTPPLGDRRRLRPGAGRGRRRGVAAGKPLPSERRLAEVLGVSRPAVREALQRMTQTGLVEVRHGGATTGRDFSRSAGLDLLPRLLVRRGGVLDDLPWPAASLEAQAGRRAERSPHWPPSGAVRALAAHAGRRGSTPCRGGRRQAGQGRGPPACARWSSGTSSSTRPTRLVFRLMFNSLRADLRARA